uniref:KIB1-4 beta-propeller domain-containing protein n=1 Tax=Aegilops tauschii TaxID=37682 RepID=M8D674_AEGTA
MERIRGKGERGEGGRNPRAGGEPAVHLNSEILKQRQFLEYEYTEDLQLLGVPNPCQKPGRADRSLSVTKKIQPDASNRLQTSGSTDASHMQPKCMVDMIFQLEAHSQDPPKLIVTFPREKLCYPVYLVECDTEILVVGHNDISLTHLAVYKLADVVLDRFIPGHGLYPGHERLCEHTRFLNLDSGFFVRVRLPLFKDHCVLDSVEGLLLLQRDEDTAIRLHHPFTGDIVELPPLASHNLHMSHPYANLPQLRPISASVSIDAGVVRVMVIFIHLMYAAVATSQDTKWTYLMHWRLPSHYGPLSFRGEQYLVHETMNIENTYLSQIFQLEAHSQDPPKLIVTFPREKLCYPVYLVECDTEILVVGHNDISLTHLAVYKLADVVLDRFIPVKSIGDKAIFVGGRNLCVSSKALPTIVGDTIVYRHPREQHFMQYCLNTSSWSLATDECSTM